MPSPLRVGQTFTDWRQIPKDAAPCVYCLVDPREPGRPRYVGSTVNASERLKSHWKPFAINDDVRAWRGALRADGVVCAMRIVAVFSTAAECRSAEWKIAARWKRRGCRLVGIHIPPPSDRCLYYASRGWPGALAEVRARRQVA